MTVIQVPPTVDASDIMTTAEVSNERRVPVETLRFWRSTNRGPASFKIGRRVFYRRSDVDRWFSQQESSTRRGDAA